jgi:magnesium transporter
MSYLKDNNLLETANEKVARGSKPGKLIIENILFNHSHFVESQITDISELKCNKEPDLVQWVIITGLHDSSVIEQIGNVFDLHYLVQEDVLNTGHRPKVEFNDQSVFVILKNLKFISHRSTIEQEQVSILFGKNYVLCFVEKNDVLFSPVLSRLRVSGAKVRSLGADYLAYTLIDVVVDQYFVLLEKIEEHLDFYENKIIKGEHKNVLNKVYNLKRENLVLNNAVWPLRELVSQLERTDTELIKKKNHIYFRDLYDHTIQVIDRIGVYRDLLNALIELHLSGSSNRTNEVMKVLTVISTIFMPLTFIVGVYGMNFKYMPELEVKWAYFAVIGLMLIIALAMLYYFRKKKWL